MVPRETSGYLDRTVELKLVFEDHTEAEDAWEEEAGHLGLLEPRLGASSLDLSKLDVDCQVEVSNVG